MNFFLTIVVDGLIQASWLFIVALGLTLVFGVLKILNIAHGSFYALGAYIAATAVTMVAARSLPPSVGFVAMLVSVALISPVGFAMGMPFPTGLTLLERVMPASVRWAWAINAASSVMGSAAAIFFAIYLGLQTTLVIGGLFYFGAWISAIHSPLSRRYSAEFASAA